MTQTEGGEDQSGQYQCLDEFKDTKRIQDEESGKEGDEI
jgi:hypothetical protein